MSNDFPLDASKYKLLHLIGCGSTSEVHVAKCLTNNKELAIKIINLEAYPMEIDLLRQEVAFWSSSQHPTVVKYYNSFTSGTRLYILMECMSGGSVADILRYAFPNGFKDECIIATILYSILRALDYIHSNKELHRDVKPANALAGSDGQIKIGDFGVAASLLINPSRFTVIGTPCYMAPEVLQNTDGYTEKADIWSFGITAIELAMGSAPYASMAPLQIIQKVLKAPPPILTASSGFSQEFRDLVKACLNYDPSKRPTAHELLQYKFFQKVKGPEYIRDNVLVKLPPLEQRFPMLRQEMANHMMNNIQQVKEQPKSTKTEWNFDVESDSPKKSDESPIKDTKPAIPINPPAPPASAAITTSSSPSCSSTPSSSSVFSTQLSNISENASSNDINDKEEVHKKGRFIVKVKKQSPSILSDSTNQVSSNNDLTVPGISSSPLFDSPKPLIHSSSSLVPETNADPVDEEEARLQEIVDDLTLKVNNLLDEGKEIKKQIRQLLKEIQVVQNAQNKH